jgi:hypothetical protein
VARSPATAAMVFFIFICNPHYGYAELQKSLSVELRLEPRLEEMRGRAYCKKDTLDRIRLKLR